MKIPVDVFHAFLCLTWYYEHLYPQTETQVDASKQNEARLDDRSDRSANGQVERSSTPQYQRDTGLHESRFSTIITMYRKVLAGLSLKPRLTPQHSDTPPTHHPLLHVTHPPAGRFVLLAAYDTLLTMILVLHIYTYIININPSTAYCGSKATKNDPAKPAKDIAKPKKVNYDPLDQTEQCERMNWHIHIAGGFASAVAALLIAMHLAALGCRIFEVCFMQLKWMRRKRTVRREGSVWEQGSQMRDIDIHTRGERGTTTSPRSTGRLTKISEEEANTGGEVTRRAQDSRSMHSQGVNLKQVEGEGEEGRLDHVLLECLLP